MPRPNINDYPEYFARYINQVQEDEVLPAFANQLPVIKKFLKSISEELSTYKYAPGKWTIKEILQHLIDAERVFTYRAMCISRRETISLPSFDENNYADNSNANARSWQSLCDECLNLRRSTEDLIKSLTPEMFSQTGIASSKPVNVLSLAFIITGHFYHHINIVRERYLT